MSQPNIMDNNVKRIAGIMRLVKLKSWITQFSRPDITFIHIPKNAGSSIRNWLVESHGFLDLRTPREIYLKFPQRGGLYIMHQHYDTLRHFGLIGDKYHQRAERICTIRDPYARAVSLFNFLHSKGRARDTFVEFLEAVRLKRMPVGGDVYGLTAANPQVDWIIGRNGEFITTSMFDVNDLDTFRRKISGKTTSPNIPKENVSTQLITLEETLGSHDECIPLINEIYFKDFMLLGYSMIPYKNT